MDYSGLFELFVIVLLIVSILLVVRMLYLSDTKVQIIVYGLVTLIMVIGSFFLFKHLNYITPRLSDKDVIGNYYLDFDHVLQTNVDSVVQDSMKKYYIEFMADNTFIIPDCILFDNYNDYGAKSNVGEGTWKVYKSGRTNLGLYYMENNEVQYFTPRRIDVWFNKYSFSIMTKIYLGDSMSYYDHPLKFVKRTKGYN